RDAARRTGREPSSRRLEKRHRRGRVVSFVHSIGVEGKAAEGFSSYREPQLPDKMEGPHHHGLVIPCLLPERSAHEAPALNCDRLRFDESHQPFAAVATSYSRFLHPAHGSIHRTPRCRVCFVDVDAATCDVFGDAPAASHVPRPDRCVQSVSAAMHLLHRLHDIPESIDRNDRPEGLLSVHTHARSNVGKDRRLEVILPQVGTRHSTREYGRSKSGCIIHVSLRLIELLSRDEGTNVESEIKPGAKAKALCTMHEFGDERLVDFVLYEQPFRRYAKLSRVGETTAKGSLHGRFDGRIIKDEHRVLAPKLKRKRDKTLPCPASDFLSYGRRSRECDGIHTVDECRTDILAPTCDDLHEAVGEARFEEQQRRPEAAKRRLLGRLNNHGVSGQD